MTEWLLDGERFADLMVWVGTVLAVSMAVAVVVERAVVGYQLRRRRRIERRYEPIARRALDGDETAERELVTSASRDRIVIAGLLIRPLIDDRDPRRITRVRAIVRAMSLIPVADRMLRSFCWWRRALALRALGLLQDRSHTAALVAALDDSHAEVRAAALDALADLADPASLQALVVRMHDASLYRGRRAAAIAALGYECEPFLLELANVDPPRRYTYARVLTLCGTERARPALCEWTEDPRTDVRAAAFEALGHVGLDTRAAHLAIDALERGDVRVRAMAAYALHGWDGPGDAASHLAQHLDDAWLVAAQAAQSLRMMHPAGLRQLQASASRNDLAGALARQMLWEVGAGC